MVNPKKYIKLIVDYFLPSELDSGSSEAIFILNEGIYMAKDWRIVDEKDGLVIRKLRTKVNGHSHYFHYRTGASQGGFCFLQKRIKPNIHFEQIGPVITYKLFTYIIEKTCGPKRATTDEQKHEIMTLFRDATPDEITSMQVMMSLDTGRLNE